MPETAIWGLIVSLILLAFGLTLKIAELKRQLKMSEDISRHRGSKFEMVKENHDKEISDIHELNPRVIDKIIEESHDNSLDENKVKILLFLSKQSGKLPTEEIAQSLSMNIQIVTFHLEELAKFKMVLRLSYVGSPPDWKLFHEGQRYLIENKLIS
uniref:Uncharacterized protein n=1 Tax=viral metagenome TaxID=1070528 RepID=A0A6H1ZSA1_9ZZZZ